MNTHADWRICTRTSAGRSAFENFSRGTGLQTRASDMEGGKILEIRDSFWFHIACTS